MSDGTPCPFCTVDLLNGTIEVEHTFEIGKVYEISYFFVLDDPLSTSSPLSTFTLTGVHYCDPYS